MSKFPRSAGTKVHSESRFGPMKALAATIAGLCAADAGAATITVNTLADNTTSGDAQCTLREALANANANADTTGGDCVAGSGSDTINLTGVSGTITLGGTRLSITDSTTVTGPGAATLSIDAASVSSIFYIYNSAAALDVTISGLTLTRGRAPTGGALMSKGEKVTMVAVALSNNAATVTGGAVSGSGATLTIRNSTLSGNTAAGVAGGGAVYGVGGITTVLNSQLTGNSESNVGGRGGAISVTGGSLVIADSTLSSNTSSGKGGAIAVKTSTAAQPTDIQRTQITGNSANGRGGAFFLYRTTGTISIASSNITGNVTQNRGGGLFLYNMFGNVTVSDTAIDNNTANSGTGNGGGIFLYKAAAGVTVTIQRSSVSGNQTSRSGGALFFYKGSGATTLENVTMSGNSAGLGGGGIFTRGPFGAGGALNIRSSTISANSAATSGGNILAAEVPLNIVNAIISDGTAPANPDLQSGASNLTMNFSLLENTAGATIGGSNNLLGIDPQLSALGLHGGTTRTRPPLVPSVVIDAGTISDVSLPTVDQRGVARVFGGRVDMGSVEVHYGQDPLYFIDQLGVPLSSVRTSNEVTVGGEPGQPFALSISGGTYSLNGGAFTAAVGEVQQGDKLILRQTSSSQINTLTTATVKIGSQNNPFRVVTSYNDTTPDPFSFAAQNNVPRSTVLTSNSVTLTGIDTPAPISITGGTYSLNGGAFVSTPGIANVNDTLRVQQTSSSNFGTLTTASLTVGTASADFYLTTLAADTTPDAFSFASQSNTALGASVTSAPITVSGLNTSTTISVAGGSYSINGGAFVTALGSVGNGDVVRLRQIASPNPATTTTTTLTIGGVSGGFSVTTVAADTLPDAFAFPSQNNVAVSSVVTSAPVTITGINTDTPISVTGGSYSINGGAFVTAPGSVRPGDAVRLRTTSSASFGTNTSVGVNIGSIAATFSVGTEAADMAPDAFAFAAQTQAMPNAISVSAPAMIAGINTAAPIGVIGGEYSINGGAFVSSAGTISAGDIVRLRVTASATFSTTVSASLNIGGVSATFEVTTLAADTTPDAFAFAPQTQLALNALATSAPITLAGINTAAPIAVTGGSYSINGGAFVSTPGTANAGDVVRVQTTAAATLATAATATLTVGGVSADFVVTTEVADTTPNAFAFAAQTEAALNATATSAAATIGGINTAAPIAVVGGAYAINGGAYTTVAGSVNAGDTVVLQLTAAPTLGTTRTATVTVGGVSAAFAVTTAIPDVTPDAFAFTTQTELPTNATATSAPVIVAGINTSTSIEVVGGAYSVNGDAFVTGAGAVNPGDSVRLRVATAATLGTTTSATLSIGEVSATFEATTQIVDTTPAAFAFAPLSEVPLNAAVTSAPITVTGINANAPIGIVGGEYAIDGGAYVSADGEVALGDVVTLRTHASATPGAQSTVTLTIGGISAPFVVTAVGPTTQLLFTLQPPEEIYTGMPLGPLRVVQHDAAGYVVNAGGSVDFSVSACNDVFDLGSAAFVDGVALYQAGPVFYTFGKTITIDASMPKVVGTSAPFDVINNPDLVYADGAEGCRP